MLFFAYINNCQTFLRKFNQEKINKSCPPGIFDYQQNMMGFENHFFVSKHQEKLETSPKSIGNFAFTV